MHRTQRAAQHPPWRGAARCDPTTDNTCHNPHPRAPRVAKGTQHAQQRHDGEGRGFVLRSPKEGLSAGTWRRKVVMCPRRGNDPTSGHPRAHQPPLGRGTSPPAWDGRLDAPGQRRRHLPSSAWTRRREVKQGKSRGSAGTTDQGNGKGRGGEKPMGTTAYGGKGSKGRAANGNRPVGAASCRRDHHTMASCHPPPPPPAREYQPAYSFSLYAQHLHGPVVNGIMRQQPEGTLEERSLGRTVSVTPVDMGNPAFARPPGAAAFAGHSNNDFLPVRYRG